MGEKQGSFVAPRGTRDLLPPESWAWQELTRTAMDVFARAGYAPVETPVFEHTEVFERGVGTTSEVVGKQMYSFVDQGGRSLTLRPEGTAPVVRAVLEHRLDKGPLPVKVAYAGSMFRQERPQRGRYRQFFQVGIEAIGSDLPLIDAEVIEVGHRFLTVAGVRPTLLVNSIGHPEASCRVGYIRILREWLVQNRDALAPSDRERIDTNPLRTFDSKNEQTVAAMRGAPLIAEHLCDACAKHFDSVKDLLGELGIDFSIEPRLVRGLDYYTRTAFEYLAEGLGAQNAVGGGGRYDGLAEALGGGPLPGIGFALGIDRVVMASARASAEARSVIDVYIVAMGEEAARAALVLATTLRAQDIGTDLDLAGRSMKGQMKDASRSGARWAVILGREELESKRASIKDLASGEQQMVSWDEIAASVRPR